MSLITKAAFVFGYGKYTLHVGDKGFVLTDDTNYLLLDASRINTNPKWAMELDISPERDVYITQDEQGTRFGFSVRSPHEQK